LIFLIAPLLTVILAFAGWAVVPITEGAVVSDINVGIPISSAMSSLSVYGIIMAGWASNSKYPFLSALRAAAQMVFLRSLDRLCHRHRAALCRLAEPFRHRAGAA